MRLVLVTALVFASGSAAFASSITPISGAHQTVSITRIACANCPAGKPEKPRQVSYKVPELARGTQKIEVVDINGEKKIARTEAWLGGSPVIYVSKLPAGMTAERAIASLHPQASGSTEKGIAEVVASNDGIDLEATTSAVKTISQANVAAAVTAPVPAPAPLALDSFQLRTN